MSLLSTAVTTASTAAAIYTSSGASALTVLCFCNRHTSTEYLDLFAVASGESVTANNQILSGLPIPAGDTFMFEVVRLLFDDGDKLCANTSTVNKVTATISYTSI